MHRLAIADVHNPEQDINAKDEVKTIERFTETGNWKTVDINTNETTWGIPGGVPGTVYLSAVGIIDSS